MSKKTIDLELLSKERENIFDDYYNIIEGVKLDNIKKRNDSDDSDYDILVKSLTVLERNIDDLSLSKLLTTKQFEKICEILINSLKEWFPIFELLVRQPNFIISFSYNLQALAILTANSGKWSILDFHKDIIFLSPSRKDRLEYEKKLVEPVLYGGKGFTIWDINKSKPKINSEQLISLVQDEDLNLEQIKERIVQITTMQEAIDNLKNNYPKTISSGFSHIRQTENVLLLAKQIYNNYEEGIFSVINIKEIDTIESGDIEEYRNKINLFDIHSVLQKIRFDDRYVYEWDIEVLVHGETFSSSQIGYLMWSISTALESIDGVSVCLENWGNGSKFFNLKVGIKNMLAKEEVKQVLDKARRAVESEYLDKPVEEVEKIKAEKEKTIKETDILINKEQSKQLFDMEIERKQIEIEDMRLELELKKIQLLKGYSELIKDGVLINDSNFQIKINEVLYLKKEPQLTLGENIEIIAEKEVRKDKNDLE